jgi:hypothetical protein
VSTIKDVRFPPSAWQPGSPDDWPTNWQYDGGIWKHSNVGDLRSYMLDTVDSWPEQQGIAWRVTFPILRQVGYIGSGTTSYSIWIDGLSTGAYLGLTVYSGATTTGVPYVMFTYIDADDEYGSGSDAIFDNGWSVGNEGWVRLRRDGATLTKRSIRPTLQPGHRQPPSPRSNGATVTAAGAYVSPPITPATGTSWPGEPSPVQPPSCGWPTLPASSSTSVLPPHH